MLSRNVGSPASPYGKGVDIELDVELRVARKFPGNADRAQDELMNAALAAAQQGKVVVRVRMRPAHRATRLLTHVPAQAGGPHALRAGVRRDRVLHQARIPARRHTRAELRAGGTLGGRDPRDRPGRRGRRGYMHWRDEGRKGRTDPSVRAGDDIADTHGRGEIGRDCA